MKIDMNSKEFLGNFLKERKSKEHYLLLSVEWKAKLDSVFSET